MDSLGEPEHVDGADDAGLNGLDRVVLIMDGRGRTGQVIDLINFEQDGFDHVMAEQLKAVVVQQVLDVSSAPSKKIVQTNDFVPFNEQALAEV